MNADYRTVLWGQSQFNTDDNAKNIVQVVELVKAEFNTLILFTIHVDAKGDLYWADKPLAAGGRIVYPWRDEGQDPSLPALVALLRAGGVETIMFDIGSGSPFPPAPQVRDWHHIETLLGKPDTRKALIQNFVVVAEWLGLDGFDFDCEEDDILPDTIATMAALLKPVGAKQLITCSPYMTKSWWLLTLKLIYMDNGQKQLVDWWNLQVYGGADPVDWIDTMKQYPGPIGVTNPEAFMVAGYSAWTDPLTNPQGQTPKEICEELGGLTRQGIKLGGGAIWQSVAVFGSDYPIGAYSSALLNGLNGRPCS
ncbi:hypothetical protein GXW82_42650 [Streptacidiphilus sp. 4-A2]|nr:hypothetical protein [Streptacidiphilus sp. 4-A2]